MKRERADRLLVLQGLAESREKAQAMILAGSVFWADHRVEKAGQQLPEDTELRVRGNPLPYVGRGGLKMEGALDGFGIDPTGLAILDVGASTGGFTDCLLQRGAARVIALDVGKGQLHWKLRQDDRVQVMEGVNARLLKPGSIQGPIDLACVDVAFISLALVLPAVRRAAEPRQWIVLVKPQFEVGKGEVGRGGIVREPEKHRQVLRRILDLARREDLVAAGLLPSPVHGSAGNREFLLHLRVGGQAADAAEQSRWIEEATA